MTKKEFLLAIAAVFKPVAQDEWVENPKEFITMNGAHVPVKEGQTKQEAKEAFIKDKEQQKPESGSASVKVEHKAYKNHGELFQSGYLSENVPTEGGFSQHLPHVPNPHPEMGTFDKKTAITKKKHGEDAIHQQVFNGNDFMDDDDIVDAVGAYAGEAYKDINKSLRTGEKPNMRTAMYIAEMDRAFSKVTPSKESVVLYRTVNDETLNAHYGEGAEGIDRGFGSYSSHKVAVNGNNLLEVHVPKGARMMSLSGGEAEGEGLSLMPEAEILMNRNTKYRVIGKKKQGKGFVTVVEIIK